MAAPVVHERTELGLEACAVQFCRDPVNLVAAGTYHLVEEKQERIGAVHLLRLLERDDGGWGWEEVGEPLETAGVFQLEWAPAGETPRLAVAGADGSVRIHAVDIESGLQPASESVAVVHDGALCTCVDWERGEGSGSCEALAASGSDGTVCVLRRAPSATSPLEIEAEWHAHDAEIWACATDPWRPGLVYTGADDCALKGWDARAAADGDGPAFVNRKSHGAGVCCIAPSPHDEHVLATGSYDENLRLWDVRSLHVPVRTVEVGCGGGVWRARWHPRTRGLLLCASMHGGVALVSADDESSDGGGYARAAVTAQYTGHESFAYGADWHAGEAGLAATCAFYCKSLHLLSFPSAAVGP
mmetsp:Transcript_7733/g.25660  ORF Transcript_7733/g.25660 Transcript_7733/m.25660 type:complete len:358 (-) Transcript_7733:52-1125(-)